MAESLLHDIRFDCVSSVEGGAPLITHEGSYFGRIPAIEASSTVGAGVGAMTAQFFEGNVSGAEIL